jgi:threonine dehydrogenase-like Zn-dependent dehydrogenase
MKALKFGGGLTFVQNAAVPIRQGEALVQVTCAGICNTDLEIVKGYAGCGKCNLCIAGDARHCPERTVLGIKGRDGAFAEFLSLPPQNLIEVPESISDEAAVFIEPLAAAFNILEQITITPSSEVAIVGDGKLAQLITRVIAVTGGRLSAFGKHDEKLELMRSAGAQCFHVERDSEPKHVFDVVIEASGSARGMSIALNLVKPRGVIVLKSTHHNPTLLDMSLVVVNEIQIIGSRCGRFRPAIDFLASGGTDVRPLISAEYPLEEGPLAFSKAAAPEIMKVILRVS